MSPDDEEREIDLGSLRDGEQERQRCHTRSAEQDNVGCGSRSIPRRSCNGHANIRRRQCWGIVDAVTHLWCAFSTTL